MKLPRYLKFTSENLHGLLFNIGMEETLEIWILLEIQITVNIFKWNSIVEYKGGGYMHERARKFRSVSNQPDWRPVSIPRSNMVQPQGHIQNSLNVASGEVLYNYLWQGENLIVHKGGGSKRRFI